jgi:hypothetical protein
MANRNTSLCPPLFIELGSKNHAISLVENMLYNIAGSGCGFRPHDGRRYIL